MKTFKLLDGTMVDLRGLGSREQSFLRDLKKMVREGVSYFELYRTAVGPGSPALEGRNRIDQRLARSPLYLTARDIATRAGIDQGLVLAPECEDARAAASTDGSMMSVAQAAKVIGISRAAVYKAIDRGTLEAQRIGNVTVVPRSSALEYRDRGRKPDKKRPRRIKTVAGKSHEATSHR